MGKTNFFRKEVIGQLTAIFMIQASSTIALAVFFSGLSLYLTENKNLPQETAALVTGLFLSLNYFLPLIGGFIANRFISYRNLYFLGTVSSFTGCLFLAWNFIYLGLALFLMSSIANFCVNIFITQLFSPTETAQRKVAFLWNYIGTNLGFMLGFLLTGFFGLQNNYFYLFVLVGAFIICSLIIAMFFINEPKLVKSINKPFWYQASIGIFIMAVLTLAIDIIFHNPIVFHTAITILTVSLFILAILYGLKNCRESEIKHFTKYIIFSLFQIMFWAFYMLTPIALMQFIEHNVQRKIFNITLASQWLPNIDSIVILAFSPMLILAIKKIKLFNEPANYYSLGFLCLSLGLASMASGLHFSVGGEKIALWIALLYLILITFGEIFISPISDSFIGEFITESMRGIITGTSKINICIGVLFSSLLANKFVLPYTNKGGLTLQGSVHLEQFFIITSCAILALMLLIPLILGDNRPKGKRFFVKNKEIIEGKV